MVKHTQTIRRQIVDELFECVWPFSGVGAYRVITDIFETNFIIFVYWKHAPFEFHTSWRSTLNSQACHKHLQVFDVYRQIIMHVSFLDMFNFSVVELYSRVNTNTNPWPAIVFCRILTWNFIAMVLVFFCRICKLAVTVIGCKCVKLISLEWFKIDLGVKKI